MIKHSVLLICYNQKDLINQSIDSILSQVPQPYELIISDDHSEDGTWEIIKEYYLKYPSVLKIFQHPKNLGIFENLNSIMRKASGDMVSLIAGDDYYKPGLFALLNKVIIEQKLNPQSNSFIIVTNPIHLHLNGKETTFNNYRIRNNNLFKERLRYGVSFRETGFSKKLWDSLDLISLSKGIYADWLFGFDQIMKCNQFFFLNESYYVYRLGVGIVKHSKIEERAKSYLVVIEDIRIKYKKFLDENDFKYLSFLENKTKYLLDPNIGNYLRLLFTFVLNLGNFSINNSAYYNIIMLIPNGLRNVISKIKHSLLF